MLQDGILLQQCSAGIPVHIPTGLRVWKFAISLLPLGPAHMYVGPSWHASHALPIKLMHTFLQIYQALCFFLLPLLCLQLLAFPLLADIELVQPPCHATATRFHWGLGCAPFCVFPSCLPFEQDVFLNNFCLQLIMLRCKLLRTCSWRHVGCLCNDLLCVCPAIACQLLFFIWAEWYFRKVRIQRNFVARVISISHMLSSMPCPLLVL